MTEEEIKIAPKGMSTERMRREAQKERWSAPTRGSRDVEVGMERFSQKVIQRYQSDVSQAVGSLFQLKEAFEGVPEAMSGIDGSMKGWQDIQRRQLWEIEAQTPAELRAPSRERIARERLRAAGKRELTISAIEKEAEKIDDKELKALASEWFEKRIKHLESFDLTFYEQPTLMNPLVLAVTQYELDPKTKVLGEEFRKKLEARRKRQRLVRVWEIHPPDRISGEASAIDNSVLKELFTYEIKDEEKPEEPPEKPIEKEFRNYERMGVALTKIKQEIKNKNGDKGKDLKNAIKDFNNHGGYVYKEGEKKGEIVEIDEIIKEPSRAKGNYQYLDERLAELEEKKGADKKEIEQTEQLRETLWARRFSGGLWSITLRAGHFNVTLNGLGDVFASRALNISENVSKRGLLRKTRGIWGPEGGTPFDLGYTDYFSAVLSQAREKDEVDTEWLGEKGISKDKYETSKVEIKDGKTKIRLDTVNSLASAELGNEDFWDDLENKYGEGDRYGAHLDNFRKADLTKAEFWGTNSFFHNPSRDKFLELSKVFDHVSEKMVNLVDLKGKKIGLEATAREQKWQELLERTIVWMKEDKDAKELIETLLIYPDAEIFGWIEEASAAEMITNQQADYLFKEYLDFPLLGGTPKGKARLRSTISIVTAPLRYPQARQYIAFGTLMELLKRGFAYVFSDEVGRR
jgi:hypothetical protein